MTDLEVLKLDAQELLDENLLREMEIRDIQFAIVRTIALANQHVDVSTHIEMLRKRIELLQENQRAIDNQEVFRGKANVEFRASQ